MRLPEWIKVNALKSHGNTRKLLKKHRLSTVCEEARCPNKSYCYSKPTATFLILGDNCTRNCGFCSVTHSEPFPLDELEPERVASAAQSMKLRHVVLTSVTRDDLPDGGAAHFAKTILELKKSLPQATIEVLTPDFKGDEECIKIVLHSEPHVFNHNIETVSRLYHVVRPQSDYKRSLSVLEKAKKISPRIKCKSGFMVGFGENRAEIIELLNDLKEAGCDFITIGQYLRPTKSNLPVVEYVEPAIFEEYKEIGLKIGFEFVASGPLVRSSMNAEEMLKE